MRFLALEASTLTPSCALWLDGEVLERVCPDDLNSSATLLPAIQSLLAEHGFSLKQLDGIAFGAGPGSFTGLRVAAGVTQGLAFAADLPVVPVETLAAVAWANGAEKTFAVLDARMSEIYSGCYHREAGRLRRVGAMQVANPASLVLPDAAEGWTICGNAVAVYPALAARVADFLQAPSSIPMAGAIAELGSHVFAEGGGLAADFAQPIYVRDKVAFTIAERLAKGGKA